MEKEKKSGAPSFFFLPFERPSCSELFEMMPPPGTEGPADRKGSDLCPYYININYDERESETYR